eukprot:TRINITY_DN26753_c0_g1_i1.p1 TRINITY_DN26753_c0_g1~~TRINITY_DN26753_c0_g1_i1.p1  ORF type:complete len:298 (-),score=40.45 TRINITY_DN26753_c0_g1_i1:16-849(-)
MKAVNTIRDAIPSLCNCDKLISSSNASADAYPPDELDRYEVHDRTRNSYWFVLQRGSSVTTWSGGCKAMSIGIAPKMLVEKCSSEGEACQFVAKSIKEQEALGYAIVGKGYAGNKKIVAPERTDQTDGAFQAAFRRLGPSASWQLALGRRTVYRTVQDLPNDKLKEVNFLVGSNLKHGWFGSKSAEECFRKFDDGLIWNVAVSSGVEADLKMSYWEGGRGDNSMGTLLDVTTSEFQKLCGNCDGDIVWEGAGCQPQPIGFVKEFRDTRYPPRGDDKD